MIDVVETILTGLKRVKSKAGAQLIGLFFLLSAANSAVGGSITKQLASANASQMQQMQFSQISPLALSMPLPLALLSASGLVVASLVLGVASIRAFYDGTPSSLKTSYFTDNIAWVGLNLVAGSAVLGIAVMLSSIPALIATVIGFASGLAGAIGQAGAGSGLVLIGSVLAAALFSIVPTYILSALILWTYRMVVTESSFLQSMQETWSMTSRPEDASLSESPRLRIAATLIAVVVSVQIVSLVLTVPVDLASQVPSLVSELWSAAVGSAVGVTTTSVFTALYEQLEQSPSTEE